MVAFKHPAVPETRHASGASDGTRRAKVGLDHPARAEGEPGQPPVWFGQRAREIWESVVDLLRTRGQLSPDSWWSLCGLCNCFVRWEALAQDVQENGFTQVTVPYELSRDLIKQRNKRRRAGEELDDEEPGMERTRPTVKLLMEHERNLRQWFAEFGLTDATLARVSVRGKKGGSSPLSRWGLRGQSSN